MERHFEDAELREQLGALVKMAVDGIISIDAEGTIRLANPAVTKIFGWSADELFGQNIRILMPNRHARHHDDYLSEYLKSGKAKIIGIGRNVHGQRKNGEEFPLHLSIGEFTVKSDRFYVGILRDLTDEASERARLQELENQLALMGRRSAVSEMGASLAHELNQPLTAIDLFLTAAKRAFEYDSTKALALFDNAREEAQRAGGIVRRIRKMVEKSDQERTLFALKPVLDDAIKLCQITDKGHTATIEMTGADNVMLLGDEIQIRQILVNLIKNALEATEKQEDRFISINVLKQDYFDIEVSDNGPGIDEAMEKKLFEPFQSSKPHGLGLGLSICRTIAESHGGELVHVIKENILKKPKGACFRLRLPDGREEATLTDYGEDRSH